MTWLCRMCAVIVGMVVAVLLACGGRSENEYAYEMRVLVEARYGDGADEFGQKDWGEGPMGAICLDVDSSGRVYIYDGPKGDVKVYDRDGIYQRTAKALPWTPGGPMLSDMSAGPNGTIYLAVDAGGTRLYSISPDGEQLLQLPFVLGAGWAEKAGIRYYLGIEWLRADMRGDVYVGDVWVADSWPGRSMQVVKSGKAVSVRDQLASLRPGRPTKWGLWVLDDSPRTSAPGPRDFSVYRSDGRLKSRFTGLSGSIWGIDSRGNVYEETAVSRGDSGWVAWVNVTDPRGALAARIEFPWMGRSVWALVSGKGAGPLIGADGSVYVLSERDDRVRVYKWERKKATSGR